MRSITARDREFSTDVNDTISASSSRPKPTRKAARAPSVAYPCPQHGRAKRQPTSTHGENGRTRLGTDKPTKPMNTPDDSTSTAQLLHPPSANCDCHASILESLASRDWSDAKNSMTSASPFIAANGARSDSRHWRSRRRAVSISMALGTVAPYMQPVSTSAASFASAICQPTSLSAGDTPGGSPSCTASRSVPPSRSASVIVIVTSPRSVGSLVSNSSNSTICSFGTSFTKRPWYVSVCAVVLPVPVSASYVSEIRNEPPSRASIVCTWHVIPSGTFHFATALASSSAR